MIIEADSNLVVGLAKEYSQILSMLGVPSGSVAEQELRMIQRIEKEGLPALLDVTELVLEVGKIEER